MPGVEVLDHDDAFVVPQLPVQLTMADVERDHSNGTALKKDVGEAARRGADVQALATANVDVERIEGVGELESASTRIWMIRSDEADRRLIVHRGTCFRRGAIVDRDLSCQDERARTFA
jgi:hypothetical protein